MYKDKIERIDRYNVSDCSTIQDLSDTIPLFQARMSPMITVDGISIPETMQKAVLREDPDGTIRPLGTVGKQYQIIQQLETLAFATTFKEQCADLNFQEYQEIDGGRIIRLKAVFPDSIVLKAGASVGDELRKEINIVNSFDGSTKFYAQFSIIRLVCSNGMTSAEHIANCAIMHTKTSGWKINEAMKVFGKAGQFYASFEEKLNYLAETYVNKSQVEKFLNDLLEIKEPEKVSTRKQNQKDSIESLFYAGRGNKGQTAYDLYNGVTEYVDHERDANAERRELSATMGSGKNLKDKALKLALAIE